MGKVNDADRNLFVKSVHENFLKRIDTVKQKIISLQYMAGFNSQVFIDYCHFTKEANQKIANEIALYILSNGRQKIFEKN